MVDEFPVSLLWIRMTLRGHRALGCGAIHDVLRASCFDLDSPVVDHALPICLTAGRGRPHLMLEISRPSLERCF